MTVILMYLAQNFTIDRLLSLTVVIYTYRLVPEDQKHHLRKAARQARTVRVQVRKRRIRVYRVRLEEDLHHVETEIERDVEKDVQKVKRRIRA